MTHSCASCKHWNTDRWNSGCDTAVADTGEVLHYREKANEKCPDYEEHKT